MTPNFIREAVRRLMAHQVKTPPDIWDLPLAGLWRIPRLRYCRDRANLRAHYDREAVGMPRGIDRTIECDVCVMLDESEARR